VSDSGNNMAIDIEKARKKNIVFFKAAG